MALADSDIDEAKRHYSRAIGHYNLREYRQAVDEFQEAYRRHPDPVILYNLGQSYRLMGVNDQALYFYKAYLRADPQSHNRTEVEDRIATLERIVSDEKTAKEKPPESVLLPTPSATRPNSDLSSGAREQGDTHPTASEIPHSAKPAYKRWWVWTIVGGIAVAAVAIGVGVGLGTQSSSQRSYPGVTF